MRNVLNEARALGAALIESRCSVAEWAKQRITLTSKLYVIFLIVGNAP